MKATPRAPTAAKSTGSAGADTEAGTTGEPAEDIGRVDGADGPASPPTAGWVGTATPFLKERFYSHGIAVRRRSGAPCSADEFVVAQGHDHTPQYAARLSALRTCVPETEPTQWSGIARHFSAVAAGDLYGDPAEEVVLASLADPTELLNTGEWWLGAEAVDATGKKVFKERQIDGGFAASSVALGDLDGDGDLDIVFGSFWAGTSPDQVRALARRDVSRTTQPEVCRKQKSMPLAPTVSFGFPFVERSRNKSREDAPKLGDEPTGPLFVYEQTEPGEFVRRWRIDSRGAADVHLTDLDGDGDLDLVAGGRAVEVVYGPLLGSSNQISVQRLPWSGSNRNPFALDVDAVRVESEGRTQVLVAASEGCASTEECMSLCAPMVQVWRSDGADKDDLRWQEESIRTPGVASAVRFTSLDDGDDQPDLLVGRLTRDDGDCQCAEKVGSGCVGAPLLVYRSAGAEGVLERAESIELVISSMETPRPSLTPMTFRVVPYAHAPALSKMETIAASGPTKGTIVTYVGPWHVVGVESVTVGREKLAFRHAYGERHVTLDRPYYGAVTVKWQVVRAPGMLVTSVSPLRAPTGNSMFVSPPRRRK